MGASLTVREHAWSTRADIISWVADVSAEDKHQHGTSYSGYWNMCHGGVHFDESKVYATPKAANDFIEANHRKGEQLFAVPALCSVEVPAATLRADATYNEMLTSVHAAAREVSQLDWQILARAKAGKSLFKSCSHCGSRISLKHLDTLGAQCPVCRKNLLRTPSDDKREVALKKKLAALQLKLTARIAAIAKKLKLDTLAGTKIWVVGGLCAS